MRIVIVGGGQAAASLAAKLRESGHQGPLTIIGEENAAPYQRPPLSKAYLLGDMGVERLFLRKAEWWAESDVTLKLGAPVEAIDRAAAQVLVGGEAVGYDMLALCTGAAPRRIAPAQGGDLEGVFSVRTLADIDLMAPQMTAGKRLVVIGGGYIGLEAAAVGKLLGLEVTVVEASARILGRVATPPMADAVRELHVGHGVTIIEKTGVSSIEGPDRVTGVTLEDGRHLPADLVIAGIGVLPETGLAIDAGLAVDNGIAVDEFGRSSDPAIWSAGDCASLPAPEARLGARLRLESVGNAIDMAEAVAANMLGANRAYQPKPWFWSDQFDAKMQMAGLANGADRHITRHGETGGLSVWSFLGDRLICVEALNDARAYMVGKRLIDAGRSADPDKVADPEIPVKSLM